MIYSLEGRVDLVAVDFVVLKVGGVCFRVSIPHRILASLKADAELKLFTFFHMRETGIELYGFEDRDELFLFELLNTVNGVGPRSAMAVMNVAKTKDILSAIKGGRADLLVQAAGVGKKIADRIVLELKDKVQVDGSDTAISKMDDESDLVEVLVGLGYKKEQAKIAIDKVVIKGSLQEKLKEVLKILSRKGG